MDLRGAGGEGFGETSPGVWGAAHGVAAGESPFPGKSRTPLQRQPLSRPALIPPTADGLKSL